MSVEFKGMNTSTERAGSSFSGYPMLLFILALLVLVVWNVAGNIPPDGAAKAVKLTFVGLIIFPLLVLAFLAAGFFMIAFSTLVHFCTLPSKSGMTFCFL